MTATATEKAKAVATALVMKPRSNSIRSDRHWLYVTIKHPTTGKSVQVFNPDQVSTWAEVIKYRNIINQYHPLVGGGIPKLTNDPNTSGGYLPYWPIDSHGDGEPRIGNAFWFHFRFNNKFEGANVGLIRDEFQRYPNSPLYVIGQLIKEIGT